MVGLRMLLSLRGFDLIDPACYRKSGVYDADAAIAKESVATGRTVREIAREPARALSEEELEALLDPIGRECGEGGALELPSTAARPARTCSGGAGRSRPVRGLP
jgi:hypothetical protein